MARALRVAEVRAEQLLIELLHLQGWDTRKPPVGEMLRQHEYKDHPHLMDVLRGISKTAGGTGDGKPEAFLVDRKTLQPVAVIEVKASLDDLQQAIHEVTSVYGRACIDAGFTPLAIALAGTTESDFAVRTFKWVGSRWQPVTYEGNPISWIPPRAEIDRLLAAPRTLELRPTVPGPQVLAEKADEINRLLRESGIKDEFRPAVIGAIMLALAKAPAGAIRKDPQYVLRDVNQACAQAFWNAKKPELAKSIRVDEANDDLARNARLIIAILELLNVPALTAEHDYLGHLYETFFRYTGGNTIGQYFTPRHIANFMADIMEVDSSDIVLDPSCGTGGFLIAVMNRITRNEKRTRAQVVKIIQKRLIGFDKEPVTAALCVANMILRGDGTTSVHHGNCFSSDDYPTGTATVVLTNPPFPHAHTDDRPEKFVMRSLDGLHHRGRMAIILPRSSLGNPGKSKWQSAALEKHRLDGVIVLPDDLFEPYASSYTAVVLMTKGIKHPKDHPVFWARIRNDGFRRYKNARIPCDGEQLSLAIRAYSKHETIPGFCGWSPIDMEAGMDAGFYVPATPISELDISNQSANLARDGAAFAVAHAPDLVASVEAIQTGELRIDDYRAVRGKSKTKIADATVGGYFDILYGQKSLHNKDGLSPGPALVISSSGFDNGCYGFYSFDGLIEAPFVTVPSTGSIGKAHIQKWSCGVTDDCLVLLPKDGVPMELLYVAAVVIRQERWRFNYGRKITPDRIAGYPLPISDAIKAAVRKHIETAEKIEKLAIEEAGDDRDAEIARERLDDITKDSSSLLKGAVLNRKLESWLSE